MFDNVLKLLDEKLAEVEELKKQLEEEKRCSDMWFGMYKQLNEAKKAEEESK